MEILLVLLGIGLLASVFSGDDNDDSAPAESGSGDGPTDPDGPGTAGDDILKLTDGYDTVSGGDGDDVITGLKGFDDLSGDAGNDELYGGDGKDLLIGGTGDDLLEGGAWHDGLFGGKGSDGLLGGNGDDMLVGGPGEDEMFGGGGGDVLLGGTGQDYMYGDAGDDLLVGGKIFNRDLGPDDFIKFRAAKLGDDLEFDNFSLTGTTYTDASQDLLNGGAGDDIMFLGANDVADGGSGEDAFLIGPWNQGAAPSQINGYDQAEDSLVVLYDLAGPEPIVTFQSDGFEGVNVLVNGEVQTQILQGNPATIGSSVFVTGYIPA